MLCCSLQVMAVSVSRDLTVRVLADPNTLKLAERQQALKNAIQKGEPKCLGVSFDLCVFVYVWIQNVCVLISFSLPMHLYATSTCHSFCPFHSIVCILSLPTFAILLVHYSTASLGRWLPPHWSSSGGGCILLKGNPFFTSSLSACSQRSSDC